MPSQYIFEWTLTHFKNDQLNFLLNSSVLQGHSKNSCTIFEYAALKAWFNTRKRASLAINNELLYVDDLQVPLKREF